MANNQEKRRTNVTINNRQYTIVGDEEPEQVYAVAELIDNKMKELKSRNPYLDSTKLAVLTAVNLGNDYINTLKKLEEKKRDED